jgi:hypothetical protein
MLIDGQAGEDPPTLRDEADAAGRNLVRLAPRDLAPSKSTLPAVTGAMPMIAWQSVVLPIPLRPTTASG